MLTGVVSHASMAERTQLEMLRDDLRVSLCTIQSTEHWAKAQIRESKNMLDKLKTTESKLEDAIALLCTYLYGSPVRSRPSTSGVTDSEELRH